MLRPIRALALARARALPPALAGAVRGAVPLTFLALNLGLALALVKLDLTLAHLSLALGGPAAPRGFASYFGRRQRYRGAALIKHHQPP